MRIQPTIIVVAWFALCAPSIWAVEPKSGNEPSVGAPAAAAVDTEVPPTWESFGLHGRILDLQDKKQVTWLLFHAEKPGAQWGSVSASLGERNGPVAAPAYEWAIVRKWLHIFEWNGKVIMQFKLLKVGEKEITVENQNGDMQVYALIRSE